MQAEEMMGEPILYSDRDKFLCEWIERLSTRGLIPKGEVLCTNVETLEADNLRDRTQVHLFCGIGGWPAALALAGWPERKPVWTASVPCQPFSVAGHQKGLADERHLWPAVRELIARCRPPIVFGEQVEGALGQGWWDEVVEDCARSGYTAWGAVLPAAAVGAPQARHRLYWAAKPAEQGEEPEVRDLLGRLVPGGPPVAGWARRAQARLKERWIEGRVHVDVDTEGDPDGAERRGAAGGDRIEEQGGVGHAPIRRRRAWDGTPREGGRSEGPPGGSGGGGVKSLGSADGPGRPERDDERGGQGEGPSGSERQAPLSASPWDGAVLAARTERGRIVHGRVGPGVQLLAHGVPGRMARLSAFGNAIVPQIAAAFIEAVAVGERDRKGHEAKR